MSTDGLKQRNPRKSSVEAPPLENGHPTHTVGQLHPQQAADYGLFMQLVRTLLLLTWFNCCVACIVTTQMLGAPLYLIKKSYWNSWIAMTKRSFGLAITALTEWSCPTPVRVSGDKSVQGQLGLLKDGRIKAEFPERLVLIANHQVYTDWLYLWWFSYTAGNHGSIYIILKESLKYIPILGQGMMSYGFIFMARKWLSDKPRLEHRLNKLKMKRPSSQSGAASFDPMWLLIFPEGTNLSRNTKRISDEYGKKQGIPPYNYQILPRSTGLFFCLQQLKGTVDWVYDCTIGYEGPPKGSFPDAYFTIRSTYLRGRPPKVVNLYWRRFAVSEIPLDDQKEFEAWLLKRWAEKDALLEQFYETGKFPPCERESGSNVNGVEYIESDVRLSHWSEAGKIFGLLMAVGFAVQFALKLWTGGH
ncbi:hypothetical protein AJ80_02720 [Polytolypa hystricis UAMH7299]|uniref:Phospholipid/glycerol acyltransferase domain-containing protein n=1 Tax=Polytolypa hystricis (strain UAMH7299) TaxID=1447883 RepID=A0A2B7YPT6_POLH7|nr:hypothetical protein AJ80_02720 [Polytolypa hystricis UAMH7299]